MEKWVGGNLNENCAKEEPTGLGNKLEVKSKETAIDDDIDVRCWATEESESGGQTLRGQKPVEHLGKDVQAEDIQLQV